MLSKLTEHNVLKPTQGPIILSAALHVADGAVVGVVYRVVFMGS